MFRGVSPLLQSVAVSQSKKKKNLNTQMTIE